MERRAFRVSSESLVDWCGVSIALSIHARKNLLKLTPDDVSTLEKVPDMRTNLRSGDTRGAAQYPGRGLMIRSGF
jgi:hypothetical protein